MLSLLRKLPFFLELFFNGLFILIYSLEKYDHLPKALQGPFSDQLLEIGSRGVPLVIFLSLFVNYILSARFDEFFRKYIFSIIIFVPLLLTLGDLEFSFWLASIHLLSSVLLLYEVDTPVEVFSIGNATENALQMFKLKPAQIVLITFSGLIIVGTALLMLPISSTNNLGLKFEDALFMSTSATCVTGLATISINTDFSLFGQIVILMLIQVGGLGIMILYSSMTILVGRSMAMKERVVMQDILDVSSLEELIDMIIDIIKYTFLIEIWGMLLLTLGFSLEGFDFGKALYYGSFHSISAFCNAGLAMFDNSLESFGTNPLIHGTVAILIILGGLGFISLKEMKEAIVNRQSFARISLHTKVVLVTTSLLLLSGTLIIFFGEFLNGLDGFSVWEKLQISFFQSVTLRTAGFTTINLGNFQAHTIYLMIIFMFIGASPGSTGGGIKTTTLAILVQSIRSTLNGRESVELFDRTIPPQTVVKTTALAIISASLATLFIFVMMKIESEQSFLSVCFEVISAFGTVGLSLGITPLLSFEGKMALVLLMFIGRVGPLTLVFAVGRNSEQAQGNFSYPDGRVMIG